MKNGMKKYFAVASLGKILANSAPRLSVFRAELKLIQVARASLEELRLDCEDFLKQRRLQQWGRENPLRQELIDRRCTGRPVIFPHRTHFTRR
jgi:hypothetical protein